jgi:pimeloyl-ACP methyl ester carboxylesterase
MSLRVRIWCGLVVVLTACGGASQSGGGGTSEPSASPQVGVAERCGVSGSFERITIEASDGTRLVGALSGSGPTGVLLAHQYPADLCQWAAYAPGLARRGFTTLALDFRCLGESACPTGPASTRLDLDVAAGVRVLRDEGVRSVAIVGGSAGGGGAGLGGTDTTTGRRRGGSVGGAGPRRDSGGESHARCRPCRRLVAEPGAVRGGSWRSLRLTAGEPAHVRRRPLREQARRTSQLLRPWD